MTAHPFLMQAAAKHGQAAKIYKQHLQQQQHPGQENLLGPDSKAFLVDRCCEAYAAISDWQGLQQWLQDMKVSTSVTSSILLFCVAQTGRQSS